MDNHDHEPEPGGSGELFACSNRLSLCAAASLALFAASASAQIDPIDRHQIQLGYDQSITGGGPQALYAYYYLNLPELGSTNLALRLAVAPVYFDGELGIRQVFSPLTDLGIGLAGGGFGDNYYEVRQGDYVREESFYGHGGGGALSIYQRINPAQLVPLNLVVRGGLRYTTYAGTDETADSFEVPGNRVNLYTRAGLRLGGMQPRLYPDIGMELSVWFERQWRLPGSSYGYSDDRSVHSEVDLFWAYAALNYAWTNVGQKVSLAFTLGGSDNADRFSAWRLGGVLPLVSEFPLILPGYYYQEISAQRFAHLYGAYTVSLDSQNRWEVRAEAAAACVDYLPGFEQPDAWQTGAGVGLLYTFPHKIITVEVRYGYGFNALRDNGRGSHSVGIVLQSDLRAWKQEH